MDSENQIGQRLRQWLDSTGKTQKEIAELIGSSQVLISRLLSGARRPGRDIQERLKEIGADIDWIMTGRKEVKEEGYKGELLAKYFIPNVKGLVKLKVETEKTNEGFEIRVYELYPHAKDIIHDTEPDAVHVELTYDLDAQPQPIRSIAATPLLYKGQGKK